VLYPALSERSASLWPFLILVALLGWFTRFNERFWVSGLFKSKAQLAQLAKPDAEPAVVPEVQPEVQPEVKPEVQSEI
jgi:hypothetical protein